MEIDSILLADSTIENIKLCDFGCGQIAIKKLKNGKYICSTHAMKCPVKKKEISDKLKNKPKTEEHKRRISKTFKEKGIKPTPFAHKKALEYLIGRSKTEEVKLKLSLKQMGHLVSKETRLKLSLASKKDWKNPNSKHNSKEYRNMLRNKMLNGQAAKLNKYIKNPSKPQKNIFKIVKEIFPSAILNCPFIKLNYNVDILIPEYKIVIEYDGAYWHKNLEKDNERQNKIEKLGYKFIRYSGTLKKELIPTKEQVKKDIEKIINEKLIKNVIEYKPVY